VNLGIVFETVMFHIDLRPDDVERACRFRLPIEMQVGNKWYSKTRCGETGTVYVNLACIFGTGGKTRCNLYISRLPDFHLCMDSRRSSDGFHETALPGAILESFQQIVGDNLFESMFCYYLSSIDKTHNS